LPGVRHDQKVGNDAQKDNFVPFGNHTHIMSGRVLTRPQVAALPGAELRPQDSYCANEFAIPYRRRFATASTSASPHRRAAIAQDSRPRTLNIVVTRRGAAARLSQVFSIPRP